MKNPDPSRAIIQEIEDLANRYMGEFGLIGVEVTPGLDHDGDAVLLVELQYDPAGPAVDTSRMTEFFHAIRRQLLKSGEDRFPHIRHGFAVNRKVVGFP